MVSHDLGDGLILRRVEQADTDKLADFQTENMHFPMGFHIREWLRGDHPTSDINGFTLVEEVRTGDIVSAACLLPQTLTYGGVPFAAGRVEAVATRPDFRRRGLVRAQFEVLHQWAETTGQMLQMVEGATWLYRDFGYPLASDNFGGMNSGGRTVFRHRLPRLAAGDAEPFLVRSATNDDLPFVRDLFARSRCRYCLASVETPAVWDFLLRGGQSGYNKWYDLRVVLNTNHIPVAFFVHDPWGCGRVLLYEVEKGTSWLAVTPSVLRAIFAECDRIAAISESQFNDGVAFALAPGHPVFEVAAGWLTPDYDRHTEWGIRVPNVPGFVRHISPALNDRLAHSPLAGHTGELRLNFYRTGLHLIIANGHITTAAWTPASEGEGDAGFTGTLFLPLLFGHRSLDDLCQWDSDCWTGSNEAAVLLCTLFPKQASHGMVLS